MAIQTTVICHFYNEEDYLPVWLRHHARLFDHGVLIDYRSTDRSREVIRELAPTWEVITTRNEMFETYAIDREVMDVERGIAGWKAVLNVTELLITDDLKGVIAEFERQCPSQQGLVTTGCLILESPEQKGRAAALEDRIWEQYHFGVVQAYPRHEDPVPIQRARLVHKAPDGRYGPGRHSNAVSQAEWPLYLFWYGWCPLRLKKLRNRANRTRVPPENMALGWGSHHTLADEEVEAVWRSYAPHCRDLLDGSHPELIAAVEGLRRAPPT